MKRPDRRTWPCRLFGHHKTHWAVRLDGTVYCYACARVVKGAERCASMILRNPPHSWERCRRESGHIGEHSWQQGYPAE